MLADNLLKTKKWFKNLKKRDNSRYIYQNELDNNRFQHDMVYGDFKGLPRITANGKDDEKASNVAKKFIYFDI